MTLTMLPGPATSTSYRECQQPIIDACAAGACSAYDCAQHGTEVLWNMRNSYLLVPTKQDTHSLASALSSAPRVYLGEAGCLWGDVVARAACWGCLCHALVTINKC